MRGVHSFFVVFYRFRGHNVFIFVGGMKGREEGGFGLCLSSVAGGAVAVSDALGHDLTCWERDVPPPMCPRSIGATQMEREAIMEDRRKQSSREEVPNGPDVVEGDIVREIPSERWDPQSTSRTPKR